MSAIRATGTVVTTPSVADAPSTFLGVAALGYLGQLVEIEAVTVAAG